MAFMTCRRLTTKMCELARDLVLAHTGGHVDGEVPERSNTLHGGKRGGDLTLGTPSGRQALGGLTTVWISISIAACSVAACSVAACLTRCVSDSDAGDAKKGAGTGEGVDLEPAAPYDQRTADGAVVLIGEREREATRLC
jgi:hypothetical protein